MRRRLAFAAFAVFTMAGLSLSAMAAPAVPLDHASADEAIVSCSAWLADAREEAKTPAAEALVFEAYRKCLGSGVRAERLARLEEEERAAAAASVLKASLASAAAKKKRATCYTVGFSGGVGVNRVCVDPQS